MKMKKMPLFWKIYLGILVLFAVLLAAGAVVLTSFLTAFEKSQSIHPAQKAFDEYFLASSFEEALKKAEFSTSQWEDVSHAASALSDFCKEKELSFYAVGDKEGEAKYNVVACEKNESTGTKIATISLEKEKEKGKFGLSGYALSEIEVFLEPTFSKKVKIPSSYTLAVNGKEVGSENSVEKTGHFWNEYLPEGVKGIEFSEFSFTDLFCDPELKCTTSSGQEVKLVENEETGLLEAPILFEEAPSSLSKRLLQGMKEYAKFIQADGSTAAVGEYFDKGSLFYKNTIRNPAIWVMDHDSFSFRNEVVEEFYFFDENTLCCHISFDQVLKNAGMEDYIDPVDMTVFARKIGGEWYIFDRFVR